MKNRYNYTGWVLFLMHWLKCKTSTFYLILKKSGLNSNIPTVYEWVVNVNIDPGWGRLLMYPAGNIFDIVAPVRVSLLTQYSC